MVKGRDLPGRGDRGDHEPEATAVEDARRSLRQGQSLLAPALLGWGGWAATVPGDQPCPGRAGHGRQQNRPPDTPSVRGSHDQDRIVRKNSRMTVVLVDGSTYAVAPGIVTLTERANQAQGGPTLTIAAAPVAPGPVGPLDLSNAIGRYGVAYFSSVCAQAHFGFSENRPGEDVLALDGEIGFDGVAARVQIKTTTQWSLSGRGTQLQFNVEEGWREKWRRQRVPAFLVVVLLERSIDKWVAEQGQLTLLHSHALWARIDNIDAEATHVDLNRQNRFSSNTLRDWSIIVDAAFEGGAA